MSPWSPEQMKQKNRKLSPKEAEQAAAIANNVYEREGGPEASPEAESKIAGRAIRMANGVVKKGQRKDDQTRPSQRHAKGIRRAT